LSKELEFPYDRKIGVVTYHSVTLEKDTAELQISELLNALQYIKDIYWIFTLPNADTGGRIIGRKIEDFLNKNPDKGKLFTSLGQLRYLSLMKHASIMVGNSSSGLIEAPSFELPVVNIGDRQRGRVRAQSVIDVVKCEKESIENAIKHALSSDYKNVLKGMKNPYGEGDASEKIIGKLKTISLIEGLIKKRFYELSA